MSADLVVWLRAQLDDDEATARAAEGSDVFDGTGIVVMHAATGIRSVTLPSHVAGFLAAFDPARVLAEVESTRLILEYAEDAIRGWTSEDAKELARDILKALALPFADRPGYLEEWRV